MRLRVSLLRILVIGPIAATLAVVAGPATRAQANSYAPPQPVVVAIDPGHGGAPNAADPSQPFDPGAIGVNGLLEKDVSLDVSKRLATLLRDDLVQVALTRTTDIPLSVPQREQVAIDAHAALFVSVHFNWFKDPSVGGSLVLYPNANGQPLAQSLSDAMSHDLGSDGISDDGTQLRDNWWIHAPMPTATVEPAYLSNPHEAALLATPDFREQVAIAIRDGIEHFDPTITSRKQQIIQWQRTHAPTPPPRASSPVAPRRAVAPQTEQSPGFGAVLFWLMAITAAAALVRWRQPVLRVAAALCTAAIAMLEPAPVRHAAARRRRRRVRARAHLRAPHRLAPRSVYDELSF